ncbi:MAG TPA: DUF418 domain-containing protein [Vicinamibacterales bacterium]|nr:DUF418 domain-containing protein [Vicinamibacterales bacterium]
MTHLPEDDRLHSLDCLRGLALCAMILVHFHQRMRQDAGGVEDLIAWGVWVLLEQKAWGTFAFLFGAGFGILLRRLDARGRRVWPIFLRRMAALALFGVIAEVGFGFGILLEYACWGVALLVLRRWPTPALLVAAAIFACARPLAAELTALHAFGLAAAPAHTAALMQAAAAAAAQDRYLTLLAARWALFVNGFALGWRDLLPTVNLALFTLGLLAVRHRVLDEPGRHVRLIAGWMIFGAGSWAVSWLVLRRLPSTGIPGADWPIAYGFGLIQDQWLCFTYIGGVILLVHARPAWTARLAWFRDAGRLALTNYLLQAIVLDALASGYGAALTVRPYLYVAATALLFGVEALASRAWLARFRLGPLEWLWRTITYARVAPLRRAAAADVPPVRV